MKEHIKNLLHTERFRSLLILWGITAISALIIFFPFLFGEDLVVFNDAGSDTRQQYLMQYATIVNHLADGSFSFWDLNNGFGTSMFALNLFNPFLILIYAGGMVLGVGHIPGILVFVLILEILLAVTFCYFFLNCFSLSEGGKMIASYIYGFSGYMLVWGQHYQFGAFVVFLPLLLCLLERAIRRKTFSMSVPLLVAVMVCSSVYMSYMSLIIAGCWLLGRSIVLDKGNIRDRIGLFLKHCSSLLLGIGIGMVIFLPMAYYLMTISSRLDSEASLLQRFVEYLSLYSPEFYKTAFLRFFSTTFQGIGDYNGYSNFYEAPVLFFSALFIILAFQYLFTIHRQNTGKKAMVIQYLAVLFFVFCLFIRAGASIFNAFAYPFSRHSFVFMPLFALVTAFTLDQLWLRRKLNIPGLLLAMIAILFAHILAFGEITEPEIRSNIPLMCLLACVMAVLIIAGWRIKGRKIRRGCVSLLLLVVACSMCLEGYTCYNDRDTLTTTDASYWGGLYNPNVEAALDYLYETDDSLYRIEKDYYSGSYCMDALAQDYHGISTYNSTPNRNLEEFILTVTPNMPIMAEHEYTWRQIGWYSGHTSLFGIKYLLSQNADLELDGFSLLKQFGDVYVYQNDTVSSFARFYTRVSDSALLTDAYGSLDLERMLLETAFFDTKEDTRTASAVQELASEGFFSSEELKESYSLEEIPLTAADIKMNGESVTIPLNRSVLDSYDRVYMEFDIRTPHVSDITVNQELPLEYHFRVSKDEKKHVQIAIPAAWESVVLTRYMDDFKGSIKNIRFYGSKTPISSYEGAEITMLNPKTDSHLSGTVSSENSGFLFLPIPYENGWTAYVDGTETEILRTDLGFVSVPVKAGEHSFTFVYEVPFMQLGMYISIGALVLWAGFLLYKLLRRRCRS